MWQFEWQLEARRARSFIGRMGRPSLDFRGAGSASLRSLGSGRYEVPRDPNNASSLATPLLSEDATAVPGACGDEEQGNSGGDGTALLKGGAPQSPANWEEALRSLKLSLHPSTEAVDAATHVGDLATKASSAATAAATAAAPTPLMTAFLAGSETLPPPPPPSSAGGGGGDASVRSEAPPDSPRFDYSAYPPDSTDGGSIGRGSTGGAVSGGVPWLGMHGRAMSKLEGWMERSKSRGSSQRGSEWGSTSNLQQATNNGDE